MVLCMWLWLVQTVAYALPPVSASTHATCHASAHATLVQYRACLANDQQH
jgi:hypothetical protein